MTKEEKQTLQEAYDSLYNCMTQQEIDKIRQSYDQLVSVLIKELRINEFLTFLSRCLSK